jgi:hypothetical protein
MKEKALAKKILCALTVLVMVMSLAACSGGKSEAAKEAPGAAAPSAAAPTKAAEEPAAAAEAPAEAPSKEEAEAPAPAEPAPEGSPAAEAEQSPAPEQSQDPAVSAELREFLEEYEAFVDEYCAFLENYNSSDFSQLARYASLAQKSLELSQKAESWGDAELSADDLAYYAEAMGRISGKLLKASKMI